MVHAFSSQKAENGTKNIFRDKQKTNKVPLMFLVVKRITKTIAFLDSVKT